MTPTTLAPDDLRNVKCGGIIATVPQGIELGRSDNWRSSRAPQQDSGFFRGVHETEFDSSSLSGLCWGALKSALVPNYQTTNPHSPLSPAWSQDERFITVSIGAIMATSPDARARQSSFASQLTSAPRIPVSSARSFYVYALYRGDEVVYVGSSTWVSSRVIQHAAGGKDFDSYSFVQVDSLDEMHEFEVRTIISIDPEYNQSLINSMKSGLITMVGLKARYGMDIRTLKKEIHKSKVETVYFRGCAYYSLKEADAALEEFR